MEYYHILNFKKEPFSNSPEPEFLFQSPQHTTCLQMLELAVRLRRGLNVVIGDVGTGKTTLCRKLIQNFSFNEADSPEIATHLLLDPALASTNEFLQTVALLLGFNDFDSQQSEWHLKERIKNYLFSKGVDEGKIIVLIIDEGQKIPEACLEILREFLNYETNNQKLLQIVIFAQKEFRATLKKHNNLSDRVNFFYYLKPLNFRQMRAMINYRISIARESDIAAQALFSFWALVLIYAVTRGYPRKVVSLCHQVILMIIIRGREKAGFFLVSNCKADMFTSSCKKIKWAAVSLIMIAVCISIVAIILQRYTAIASKQIVATPVIAEVKQRLVAQEATKPTVETVPESQSSVFKEDKNQDSKMPELIGTLEIKKRRTFWSTVHNIYGEANSEITETVIKANPHIKNRNRIPVGAILNLPAIPAKVRPVNDGLFFIQLDAGKNLEEMYKIYCENPYNQTIPPTSFFPVWNKKAGVTFTVLVDKYFSNAKVAQDMINSLPASIAAKAKIISQWDESSIYFNHQNLKHEAGRYSEAK